MNTVNLEGKLALPGVREEVHMLLIEPAGTPNTGDPKTAAARRTL